MSEASCKRLLDLSDAFSPLSRVTFKKEKHSCNLFSEVNNVGLLMETVLSYNEITFKNEVDPEITIGLHPGEIQTILINLIDNAIYCPIHWPKSEFHRGISQRAEMLYSQELSLVCDQRYGSDDMNRIVECIRKYYKR